MMVRIKQHILLALFLLIVFIPAVILSYFAVRAVNQEEMVQRRRLEDTLLLELDRTNTILKLTIDNIVQELHETLPELSDSGYEKEIIRWKDSVPLAGIPYILDKDRSVLYPDIRSKEAENKKDADLFYWRYLNLFSNSEAIPVYRNIAEEYEKEILDKDISSEKTAQTDIIRNQREIRPEVSITASEYEEEIPEKTLKPGKTDTEDSEENTESVSEEESILNKEAVSLSEGKAAENEKRDSEPPKEVLSDSSDAVTVKSISESSLSDNISERDTLSSSRRSAALSSEYEKKSPSDKNAEDYGHKDSGDFTVERAEEEVSDVMKKEETDSSLNSIPPPVSDLSETPVLRSKKAVELFESDSALQERIYTRAEEEGQQYLTRNLLPQITTSERKENTQTVIRSVYIESTQYFNEIIKNEDYGIIPRTFDSTFILLYWEKRGDMIAGCEINMDAFNRRLIEAAGKTENSFRVLNIIDRSGKPLIPVSSIDSEKWRQPFVAKEISDLLPYWETAILLRNPEDFQKQIESSRYFMSLLVFFLCLLIFTGITAVYSISSSRMKNVQRRVGFVTNVSHELKTPLTSIRMYSEMMAEGYQKNPDKIKKYSGYIASESQRLTRLINNVLDFAKLEKGTKIFNPVTSDINIILKEILPSLKEEFINKGFKFEVNLSREALFAECDKEGFAQVLINLFSNARKYSVDEKYIELKTFRDDRHIIVSVSDRGKGIAKKYRKKIFRDFFRIDTSITSDSKGTGLGLAIAKKIMKQHKGDLIYSPLKNDDYRQGSIFSMVFPLPDKKDNKL